MKYHVVKTLHAGSHRHMIIDHSSITGIVAYFSSDSSFTM